jgi:hypothetical protein
MEKLERIDELSHGGSMNDGLLHRIGRVRRNLLFFRRRFYGILSRAFGNLVDSPERMLPAALNKVVAPMGRGVQSARRTAKLRAIGQASAAIP